jgi:hypothetical protein
MNIKKTIFDGIELCVTNKSYGITILVIGCLTMVLFQDNATALTIGKLLFILGSFCAISSVLQLTRTPQIQHR